jgi:hypothetical protein
MMSRNANNDDDEEDVDEAGVMEARVCWPQLKLSRPIEPLQQQF